MEKEFFPARPEIEPKIYVYKLIGVDSHEGYVKIGYTTRLVEERVAEQLHVSAVPYQILYSESCVCNDGSTFIDKDVHKVLKRNGFIQLNQDDDKNEWFKCTVDDVKEAIHSLKTGEKFNAERNKTFGMRPEQEAAVEQTYNYYENSKNSGYTPKFLWNAKMRFGKTFTAYQLAKKMNLKKILILTFKPAVENSWAEDLNTHKDFEGWQFISNKDANYYNQTIDEQYELANKNLPIVVFGSFQDLLGKNENGGIKVKNEFIHTTTWDMVIFDEYHFGAWRDSVTKLFEKEDEEEDFDYEKYQLDEAPNAYNESFIPISTKRYLFLSGTPFKAINSGEFIEEQIFNWTYSDEQKVKENWVGENNPYLELPRMVMMTYKIPDSINQIALQGEFNEFDLNVFFKAEGKGKKAKFVYKNEVQKWLDLIRGAYLPSTIDDLKLSANKKPPMPYSDSRLLNVLQHTLWYLPDISACDAMENLLKERTNTFYNEYKIINCSGTKAGIGVNALIPVRGAMDDPLKTKTITLTCGKLTTGVTVKPWTGVFMLRNLKSPETYFQTAFRVQSPWKIKGQNGDDEIIKKECYVFDFALDRALRQISEYSCKLNPKESNPEKNVEEFINFLPVLAFDGSSMKQIDAQDILDITTSGTSATLLARRWESALLVNVDNDTLERLINTPGALNAIMNIEGFRALNKNTFEKIINRSEKIKNAKKNTERLTEKEKNELNKEEKENKNLRKTVQEKLIKFATRIPVFMYLTDYREKSLQDVINKLEPNLFKKVTGLDTKDFEVLCNINVFNASIMNEAIFKFKRYEDSSLVYTGVDKHINDKEIGGWDITIKKKEYETLFYNQQSTITDEFDVDQFKLGANINNFNSNNEKYQIAEGKEGINEYDKNIKIKKEVTEALENDLSVIHDIFGEGKVIMFDRESKYIKVQFGNAIKQFQFPDIFVDGKLKIKNNKKFI